MKLGFAKSKLDQLDSKLDSLFSSVAKCPRGILDETINEINSLLSERQELGSKIISTERNTTIGGNSLDEIYRIINNLLNRIRVLTILENRTDLSDPEREMLYLQLKEFSKTKDNLNILIEKTIWETDLISF